ncbi:MAG: HAD-IC family P-type ATPase [Myxococcaceae bacterium]|nr:HAD-IC family P-type ATPase [Myxococcaceae bacterium]
MRSCRHCRLAYIPKNPEDLFCCTGCCFAYRFLNEAGLSRFYELMDGTGFAVGNSPLLSLELFDWIIPRTQPIGSFDTLEVDIQGLHCTACIWLIEQLFQKEPGCVQVRINSSIGRMHLIYQKGFDLRPFLLKLAQIGYQTAPASQATTTSSPFLFRFAICAALSMNSMVLSASFYFGLATDNNPTIYSVFSWTNLILSLICLWVGGSVFFKSAYQALKHGLIHLDLPIALGLFLGFLGSLISFFSEYQQAVYFDTLNIFVTFMLLGRILQNRMIEHNRSLLLRDNSIQNLCVRKITASGVSLVPAQSLNAFDRILVVPGEVLPCQGKLLSSSGHFSLEWIQGESTPHLYQLGDLLPAGAFHIGSKALTFELKEGFQQSQLVPLLANSNPIHSKNQVHSPLFPRLSRFYTLGVILIALAGFLWWIPSGFQQALNITVALLVVTCPCAIGLATPLALDSAIVHLRRYGLYIRNSDFFMRIRKVRHCFFDKTGTLTLGHLSVENPEAISELSPVERNALFQMVVRSNHPKSKALLGYLSESIDPQAQVEEITGVGMRYGEWTLDDSFKKSDRILATFRFAETLKEDVLSELAELRKRKIQIYLLSGDRTHKVSQLAEKLAIPESHIWGNLSPGEKAEKILAIDHQDTLMIGDGINDSPAFDTAYCAGTPAILHPSIPGKADYFYLGTGLGPLGSVLRLADHLHHVIHRNLLYALGYNVLAITLAFSGVLSPVFAAIFMPLSSISIIAITLFSFRQSKG